MTTHYTFQEVPEQLWDYEVIPGVVFVCHNDKIAQLRCHCCQAYIKLNLFPLDDQHQGWTVTGNTLSPSINRTVGCKSHFTITNGKVEDHLKKT